MRKNYLLLLFLLTSFSQVFGQSEGSWKNEVLPKKTFYNKGDTLTLLFEYYYDPEFISSFLILSDIPKTEIVTFLRTSDYELVEKMQYVAYSVIHAQNNSFKTFTKNFNIKI